MWELQYQVGLPDSRLPNSGHLFGGPLFGNSHLVDSRGLLESNSGLDSPVVEVTWSEEIGIFLEPWASNLLEERMQDT